MNYSEELRKRLEEEDIADWHGLMQKPEVIWALLREIDRLNAERRWIPVSEMLPELPDWVTCLTDRNEVFTATYVDGEWFDDVLDKISRYQHVTHWMPLPPPPEEGE